MCKLIYSMTVALDGYISGPDGEFDWSAPDEELHRFHNDQVRELGGHLLGRRLYEVMSYWETAEERNPAAPQHASSSLASGRICRRSSTRTRS
jgi:dihydrofolate reductase